MGWEILLFLLCPLMMLFMMKGMHGGHSHDKKNEVMQKEIENLKKSVSALSEENKRIQQHMNQNQIKLTKD